LFVIKLNPSTDPVQLIVLAVLGLGVVYGVNQKDICGSWVHDNLFQKDPCNPPKTPAAAAAPANTTGVAAITNTLKNVNQPAGPSIVRRYSQLGYFGGNIVNGRQTPADAGYVNDGITYTVTEYSDGTYQLTGAVG
jgi:hypothetical protein